MQHNYSQIPQQGNINDFMVQSNQTILQAMEQLGFSKDFTAKSLKRSEFNHATGTYYILETNVH